MYVAQFLIPTHMSDATLRLTERCNGTPKRTAKAYYGKDFCSVFKMCDEVNVWDGCRLNLISVGAMGGWVQAVCGFVLLKLNENIWIININSSTWEHMNITGWRIKPEEQESLNPQATNTYFMTFIYIVILYIVWTTATYHSTYSLSYFAMWLKYTISTKHNSTKDKKGHNTNIKFNFIYILYFIYMRYSNSISI